MDDETKLGLANVIANLEHTHKLFDHEIQPDENQLDAIATFIEEGGRPSPVMRRYIAKLIRGKLKIAPPRRRGNQNWPRLSSKRIGRAVIIRHLFEKHLAIVKDEATAWDETATELKALGVKGRLSDGTSVKNEDTWYRTRFDFTYDRIEGTMIYGWKANGKNVEAENLLFRSMTQAELINSGDGVVYYYKIPSEMFEST